MKRNVITFFLLIFALSCSQIVNTKTKKKQQRLISQSLDLAKLSHGLLKGEDLTNFIKRSFDIIK